MDGIDQGPGPDLATGDAYVESDRLTPIVRLVRPSNFRWPAGIVMAVIAVLATSGLAFGAQIVPALQGGGSATVQMAVHPLGSVTGVVVGDDPTPEPTLATSGSPMASDLGPTTNPTLPPSGYLSFSVQAEDHCARLNWAPFDDPNRAYYRIVRSTDAGVEWPLGAGDTLIASIRDASQLTFRDCPTAGTYTYRVFVDKATTAGYVVLVSSHSLTITLSGSVSAPTLPPTPTPTATPATLDMGPLSVTANADGTYTISWNAYTGPLSIGAYALCYTTNENVQFGYVEGFGGVISVSKTANSWTGTFPWAATLKVKIEALYWPPAGRAQKAGETYITLVYAGGSSPAPSSPTS
jgi:hypothetical protein